MATLAWMSVALLLAVYFASATGNVVCGSNEVFACGSACDTTCQTLGEICPIVNIRCNDRCYCINGYARNAQNICIPIKECPPKSHAAKHTW